jgi:hypothetical protein
MAKQEAPKTYLQSYNAAAMRKKFAAALTKPAFGRITDVPGYENVLWGGRTAGNLAFNLQKAYQSMLLVVLVGGGYVPSKDGMGVASKVVEGRAKGLLPERLRHMEPADWRAVTTNLPLASTEGGKGISVGGMINILEGLGDLANGKQTEAVGALIGHLKLFAKVAPEYAAFRPTSEAAEANAAAARKDLRSQMLAEDTETAAVA